jgi:hypothetical protein
MKYGWNHTVKIPLAGVSYESSSRVGTSSRSEIALTSPLRATKETFAFSQSQTGRREKLWLKIGHTSTAGVFPGLPGTVGSDETSREAQSTSIGTSLHSIVPVKLPEQVLRSYVGTYFGVPPNDPEVRITFEDGKLNIQVVGMQKIALVAVSETAFFLNGVPDDLVEFSKDKAGSVHQLDIYQSDRHLTAHRQGK